MGLIVKAIEERPSLRIRVLLSEFGVSKSSYYRKLEIENKDRSDFDFIQKVFLKHRSKVGIRQLKMLLERECGVIMNHKKIARIKKKYGLETQIRKRNKYKLFVQRKQEHDTCPNFLEQNFKVERADQIYSTDITTFRYAGRKGYLAAVKDLCTKEIVGFEVSNTIDLRLAHRAVDRALSRLKGDKKKGLIVHSDQGFHYTHFAYRNKLAEQSVLQSMSRKGNCLDNAPIESFFGLIKDHLDLKECENIEDVRKEVTSKIKYYNCVRPQVELKKMPPSEYRRHLNS